MALKEHKHLNRHSMIPKEAAMALAAQAYGEIQRNGSPYQTSQGDRLHPLRRGARHALRGGNRFP